MSYGEIAFHSYIKRDIDNVVINNKLPFCEKSLKEQTYFFIQWKKVELEVFGDKIEAVYKIPG